MTWVRATQWMPGTARFIVERPEWLRWIDYGVRPSFDMLPFACLTEWDAPTLGLRPPPVER